MWQGWTRPGLANSQEAGAPCSQTGVQQGVGRDFPAADTLTAGFSLITSPALAVVVMVAPF